MVTLAIAIYPGSQNRYDYRPMLYSGRSRNRRYGPSSLSYNSRRYNRKKSSKSPRKNKGCPPCDCHKGKVNNPSSKESQDKTKDSKSSTTNLFITSHPSQIKKFDKYFPKRSVFTKISHELNFQLSIYAEISFNLIMGLTTIMKMKSTITTMNICLRCQTFLNALIIQTSKENF